MKARFVEILLIYITIFSAAGELSRLKANTILSTFYFIFEFKKWDCERWVSCCRRFFTTTFRMPSFWETRLSEKSQCRVIWSINHQSSKRYYKIRSVRVIYVLSHSLKVSMWCSVIAQVVIPPFFFNGHAGGTTTVDSDLFLENTKIYLRYAQDQWSCYQPITMHAAKQRDNSRQLETLV